MAEENEAKAHKPDDGTVDIELGENEEAVEVEVEVAETTSEESEDQSEDDDEHQKYTAGVQKRIDRLTKKMREAERQREEAVTYAQSVQTESDQLKAKLKQVDAGYLNEYGGRITAELAQAQDDYKRAIATGDPDKALEAQQKLTNLQVASSKLEDAKRAQQARAARQEQAPQAQQQQQPQQAPQQQPQQAPQRPDPKAEEWADKNEWFGKDRTMTFAAYGIHQELIEDEGFDPQTNEYYDELDKRIKQEFPHKFSNNSDNETSRKPAQNVAGVSRTNSSTGRSKKRKLTPSQVAIAKRLGVPLEEYAKYVK
tara:strand:+ start:8144 stop:9079 length:936 start_codon:yes stop_codon:yes gene_type:complete